MLARNARDQKGVLEEEEEEKDDGEWKGRESAAAVEEGEKKKEKSISLAATLTLATICKWMNVWCAKCAEWINQQGFWWGCLGQEEQKKTVMLRLYSQIRTTHGT